MRRRQTNEFLFDPTVIFCHEYAAHIITRNSLTSTVIAICVCAPEVLG
jgi:hypothetical protein